MPDLVEAGVLAPLDEYVDKYGYRKDLFGDPAHQAAFQEKHGRDLAPLSTWDEFYDTAQYFSGASDGDGAALIHAPGLVHYIFLQRYRTAGGKLFDPETMAAEIGGDVGVAVLEDMVRQLDNMPQGAAGWGPIEVLNAWLAGDLAQII